MNWTTNGPNGPNNKSKTVVFNQNKMTSTQKKKIFKWGTIFFFIFLLLLMIPFIFNFLTNYIWMESLGFESVYTTTLITKISLVVAGFLLFFIFTYLTLAGMQKIIIDTIGKAKFIQQIGPKKMVTWSNIIISILIGLLGSFIVQKIGWEPVLKVFNQVNFNQADPHFGHDLSFYFFTLPVLNFVLNVLMILSVILAGVAAFSYFMFQAFHHRIAKVQLAFYITIFGLSLAATHYLGMYNALFTNKVNAFQKSAVYGVSYTDDVINIPSAYVLAAVTVLATIWAVVTLFRKNYMRLVIPFGLYLLVLFGSQAASFVVQQFVVSPNEFQQETPYLEENLAMTRQAYELEDMEVKDHPGNASLDEEMIERNEMTINNIRINDSRPLNDVYNQIQTFRTYYEFEDIDIDRYMIDGEYEQVFIGARELSMKDLPEQAQTWVNQNLRYTHGYGVAMSHVNEVTAQGQPEYLVKNLPTSGEIDVERPQIYFGEQNYPTVIVNSAVDEFDYPDGESNVSNRYEADTGIPFTGLNRLLFSLNEMSFRMLVSDQVTDESQILVTRNIKDRVERIAPFFEYEKDPYIYVRDDGSLAWIINAYLTDSHYPYAEKYNDKNNYIKNSVKIEIDAYTGEVNFYIVDEEDPLVQTYANMFPDLFTDDIPENLQDHFRYPERLFSIQAEMYGTYHMENLEVFYNREDFWQFPTEKYYDQDIEMDPYYVTMKLPEAEQEEFVLMMPYTPRQRQNMIAWIGVRNDGEHYGEKIVYRFPKQRNVYGPQQIENRINQDSTISQELNLWSQGGSKVIRGNLLAIPIEDTMMYVEPIYIESSNETSLPEVKQVVIAYEDYIVMESTFDKALNRILTYIESNAAPDEIEEGEAGVPLEEANELLNEVSDLFEQYQNALSNGDWQEAADVMTQIEEQLAEME